MQIVKPKIYGITQMFKLFKKTYKDDPDLKKIPYWMFSTIIYRNNKKLVKRVIFGETYNLGNYLGYVKIKKIKANRKKQSVDWGESMKYKKELLDKGEPLYNKKNNPTGKKWLVYFDSRFYLRWAWVKKHACRVKNKFVYSFTPANNKSRTAQDNDLTKLGPKGQLNYFVKKNPILIQRYESQSKEYSL